MCQLLAILVIFSSFTAFGASTVELSGIEKQKVVNITDGNTSYKINISDDGTVRLVTKYTNLELYSPPKEFASNFSRATLNADDNRGNSVWIVPFDQQKHSPVYSLMISYSRDQHGERDCPPLRWDS